MQGSNDKYVQMDSAAGEWDISGHRDEAADPESAYTDHAHQIAIGIATPTRISKRN